MTIKELREQRAKLIEDARAIIDLAAKENRARSDEETAKFDEMFAESERINDLIRDEERTIELARAEAELADEHAREKRAGQPAPESTEGRVMTSFRSWISGGQPGEHGDELRALSAGINTQGGFIVVPEEFVRMLIKKMDDLLFIRALATITPLAAAASAGIPTLDADPEDSDWTTELQTGSEDTTMAFGKREMIPHPMAKRIKVSNELLRIAALPVEQIINDRMLYKFGVTQEKAYLTGDGNQKPLGLFTASNDGIPTARDVSTDNTSTAITFDGLKEAKYSLKAGYWRNAQWLFHRDAVKQIAKIKDLDDQYIWQRAIISGEPDRLLDFPVNMSEFVPNTFTADQYVGMVGDFSHYWIVDSLVMQMQRLAELYAETNQIGFIGRYEGDGAPVLGEAFARVQLAS